VAKEIEFDVLRDEYTKLLETSVIRQGSREAINKMVLKIKNNESRYQKVSAATGVPWEFIGTVHAMESGCNFSTHLHNGDPLTAKTKQVPRGRPLGTAPFTWEESAIDALKLKKLDKVTKWTKERIAYELERYNGFGYRLYHGDVLSPYLWSGTCHYSKGKYVADGKWDSSHVSRQVGAIPIYRGLTEGLVSTVSAKNSSKVKVNNTSQGFLGSIAATLGGYFTLDYFQLVVQEVRNIKEFVSDNALWFVLGGIAVAWLVLRWMNYRTHKDYLEGRYTPSGESDA